MPEAKDSIEILSLRIDQMGIVCYVAAVKAFDMLSISNIKPYSELDGDGYQRQLYEERAKEVYEYLTQCAVPVLPAVLASLRRGFFFTQSGNGFGTLKVTAGEDSIWLIDGQHRLSGFWFAMQRLELLRRKEANASLTPSERDEIERCAALLDYQLPAVFVDNGSATNRLANQPGNQGRKEIVESTLFYVINKTQKGISPSLKDLLAADIARSGITGIRSVSIEPWRLVATELALELCGTNKPLSWLVNKGGLRSTGKPVQLNSLVSSFRPLVFGNSAFEALPRHQRAEYVTEYWEQLRKTFPIAFQDYKNYLLLTAVGIYLVNWLAADIIALEGAIPSKKRLVTLIGSISGFDWSRTSSPIRGLGGVGGVREARERLLEYARNHGLPAK